MPAQSETQRRLFGAVLAAKRGEAKAPSTKIKTIADQVTQSQAKDFAVSINQKKRRQGIVQALSPRG